MAGLFICGLFIGLLCIISNIGVIFVVYKYVVRGIFWQSTSINARMTFKFNFFLNFAEWILWPGQKQYNLQRKSKKSGNYQPKPMHTQPNNEIMFCCSVCHKFVYVLLSR